jgi:hypothetical protein
MGCVRVRCETREGVTDDVLWRRTFESRLGGTGTCIVRVEGGHVVPRHLYRCYRGLPRTGKASEDKRRRATRRMRGRSASPSAEQETPNSNARLILAAPSIRDLPFLNPAIPPVRCDPINLRLAITPRYPKPLPRRDRRGRRSERARRDRTGVDRVAFLGVARWKGGGV